MGAQVTGYALDPPTEPSLFELARVGSWWTRVIADVRDLERLKAEMLDAAPDIVIHMAAQPLVRDSYMIPVETYAINVMGTVHLLEAVRSCPERTGGGQCHHRQMLRKPRMGLGLPRERTHGGL